MNLTKRWIILLAVLLTHFTLKAQTDTIKQLQPTSKREFRGVWIATVVNIDWPLNARATAERQQQELTNLLEFHHQTGINAVMLQVRPAADALYAKSREPWSRYLTGQQGRDPGYDPLELAVTEAHKRGMELHAWFNPYRATFDANFASLSPQHVTKLHPDWFFTYGRIKLFNPGLPDVREYIVQVILDVVKNYDVDGIHMDDYFYPYPIAGQRINDAEAFQKYGGDFTDIRAWRRNNVDVLIKMMADSIHKYKPQMKFGISPFGIWQNANQNPEGSATNGGASYVEQFADTRKWIKEGWIDYISPQLYWPFNNRSAAFEKLVDWWSLQTNGHHLYIGQAAYRINEVRSPGFKLPDQLPAQIRYIRNNARVQGSIYFSSASLKQNSLGFTDSLRRHYYQYKALPPPMLWLDSVAPNNPRLLTARAERSRVLLHWTAPLPARDKEPVYGYVVYRFEENEKLDFSNPAHIINIQYNATPAAEDNTAQPGKKYIYAVTAIDRLKNESEHSEPFTVTVQ
jgi:uncharacterized lipoprotein YddW (UPF0748 family)